MASRRSHKKPEKGGSGLILGFSPWTVYIAVFAVFIFLKTFSLHYAISDENIYFYMGKLVAEGKMPYKDFFFGHPPIGVLINGAIFKLFGFNFVLLKSVSVLSVALSSYFLFKAAYEAYGGRVAVLSAALYLFCQNVLRASSHPMGADVTVLFMLASFYYFMRRRYLISGALVGVASAAGLYALVLLVCFVVFQAWRRHDLKEATFPLVAGFAAVFAVFNVAFYLLAGQPYIDQVYLYQLAKPALQLNNVSVLADLIRDNFLVILPLIGLPALLERRKSEDMVAVLSVVALGYVIFLVSLKTIFDFYFMLAAPFLALIAGGVLVSFFEGSGSRWLKRAAVAAYVLFTLWGFLVYYVVEADYFMAAPQMARFVNTVIDSNQTIFGDSETTPLIALLSERRLAFDEADTNVQRFLSNETDINALLPRLKGEGSMTLFLVSPLQQGVGHLPEGQRYLSEYCKEGKGFDQPYVGTYMFYYCGD